MQAVGGQSRCQRLLRLLQPRFHDYRDFTDQPEHFRLVRWLYTRAWLSAERPVVLFDLTTARLAERKILLPGVTVLTRLIACVRDHAAARLWRSLARLPSPKQKKRLEGLLTAPAGERLSTLDGLRRAPTRISSPAMVAALDTWTPALSYLRASGQEIKPEDQSRLSPLGSDHFNVLGRYDFHLTEEILTRHSRNQTG